MKVFCAFGQLPELRKFSKAHRQLIYAECIVPMLAKYAQPVLRELSAVAVFVVLLLVLPWTFFDVFIQLGLFVAAILAAIGFSHLWSVAVISQHRTELRERIQPLVWEKMAALDIFAPQAGDLRPKGQEKDRRGF